VGLRVGQDGSGAEKTPGRLPLPSRYSNNSTGAFPKAEYVHVKSASWEAANFPPPLPAITHCSGDQCHTHLGALFTIPRNASWSDFHKKQINSLFFFVHIQTKGRHSLLFHLSAVVIVTIPRFQAVWTHYVSPAPLWFSGRTKERLDASFHVTGSGPINSYCNSPITLFDFYVKNCCAPPWPLHPSCLGDRHKVSLFSFVEATHRYFCMDNIFKRGFCLLRKLQTGLDPTPQPRSQWVPGLLPTAKGAGA